MRVEVAQDDDAIFCTVWVSFFIYFDFGDSHGWKGVSDDRAEDLILFLGDVFPRLCSFMQAEVFFQVRFVPNNFVIF